MICFLRASDIDPDPRVQREVQAAVRSGRAAMIVGWRRDGSAASGPARLELEGKEVPIWRCGIRAPHGAGLRNLMALALFQPYLVWRLVRSARSLTAVHACDLSTGLAGLAAARALRVPLVYDVFDYYADSFPVPRRLKSAVRRLETFVINHAEAVILTSEERLAQIAPATPRRLVVVHNSPEVLTEVEPCTGGEGTADLDLRISYVGILTPGRLLEGWLRVVARHPEWSLTVAGFGPLESTVQDYADSYPNIRYLGRVDHRQAMAISAASDVLFATYDPAVPNHAYSTPNKLYEAMGLGKVIVVAEGTGVDEVVARERLGLVIEYSEDAVEECLIRLSQDDELRADVARVGPSLLQKSYSWPEMERRLDALYDELGV